MHLGLCGVLKTLQHPNEFSQTGFKVRGVAYLAAWAVGGSQQRRAAEATDPRLLPARSPGRRKPPPNRTSPTARPGADAVDAGSTTPEPESSGRSSARSGRSATQSVPPPSSADLQLPPADQQHWSRPDR